MNGATILSGPAGTKNITRLLINGFIMKLSALPTAAVADACVRLKLSDRAACVAPLIPSRRLVGRVLPARHAGSVDVFFEAMQTAQPGDILVIDNGGRMDEACIGDLTALEARHHEVSAIVVDGCHRDSEALLEVGLPIWSRGRFPYGPRTARNRPPDALASALIDGFAVSREDLVVLDDDGAVFVAAADAPRVWQLAHRIQVSEADQAQKAREGESLCEQFQVVSYLSDKKNDPDLTFRAHLKKIGKAIEE